MNKTVLITGVAGLLGSRLADWIIENQPSVRIIGIDNLSGGFLSNIPKEVDFCNIDLSSENVRVSQVFKKDAIDYVFHFAAYAAEGLSPFIRTFNYDNNLRSTAGIINECIKHSVERLVFTSSLAVYGHGDGGIFAESQRQAPIDPYGVAKFACEMDLQIAGEQHGLDWCIIRPHNVYGKKQNIWDKYRNVLGIWMYQHLNGLPLSIFGDGSQTRAFSYIDDSLEPLWRAATLLEASQEIINLGGVKEYSILEAAEIMKSVTGASEVEFHEARHEVEHSIPTWQKSVDVLGFEHKTDLDEGLGQMWSWAKSQEMRERFVWPSYELEKGIYDFWKPNREEDPNPRPANVRLL